MNTSRKTTIYPQAQQHVMRVGQTFKYPDENYRSDHPLCAWADIPRADTWAWIRLEHIKNWRIAKFN